MVPIDSYRHLSMYSGHNWTSAATSASINTYLIDFMLTVVVVAPRKASAATRTNSVVGTPELTGILDQDRPPARSSIALHNLDCTIDQV